MPISLNVTIVDWGKPGAPMVIVTDGTTLTLMPPDCLTDWHKSCAEYATYELDAPSNLRPGSKSVHFGLYGYLRVCNSLCLAKSGVSIFDLADTNWRNAYDDQRSPHEAVDELLAEEGFTAGEA
jgi:hypothetical protein